MLDVPWRSIPIDRLETVEFLHGLEFLLNETLILDEAAVHVRRAVHIHAGFPIVQHGMLPQVPLDQNFRAHGEIKDGIGNKSDAVDLANPCRLNAANDRARHQRIDVTIGQNDEARTQRRNDPVLELVGEIGRIEQAEGSRAQNISAHGLLEFAANEHGPLQSDVYRGAAAPFQPIAQ